ncbi:MAG TPA: hypothetical protein VFI65_27045 [Streptosporangiaceae bacterium]|nr:hypothetical protein [Streptosporangiaceae bacterium]
MADPLIKLYRADWTRWSFSAEVVARQNNQAARALADRIGAEFRRQTSGVLPIATAAKASSTDEPDWSSSSGQILLAGGRYRYQPPIDTSDHPDTEELENNERARIVLSDGEFCWVVWSTGAERYPADVARTPIHRIVRPAWLLSQLRLTVTGTTELAGRPMLMVRGKPRPCPHRWAAGIALLDWVDVLIDAELGVMLRRQVMYQGQPLSVFELRNFTLDPVAATESASFRPDDGIEVDENDLGPDPTSRIWSSTDWLGANWNADDHEIGAGTIDAPGEEHAPNRASPGRDT